MNGPLLATLIHLSDLHFGRKFFRKFHAVRERIHPPFQAQHSADATLALAARIHAILGNRRRRAVPIVVIHTGDLTCAGRDLEFAAGRKFLHEAHDRGGYEVGLRLRPSHESTGETSSAFDIPGNHDLFVLSNGSDQFKRWYPQQFPIRYEIRNNVRPIVILGVDSNHGKRRRYAKLITKPPWWMKGLVDEGQLSSACVRLEAERDRRAIRVVCIHHPLEGDPATKGLKKLTEESIRLANRSRVADLLVQSGAHLVIAGHIHRYVPFANGPRNNLPFHVVAGSSTQVGADCNFVLFDIYEDHAEWFLFRFSLKWTPSVFR